MKRNNLLTILVLSGSIIFSGCASMSNTGKGAAIGAGGGAALGAGIGALIGKGKGAAIGAAVGGAVGAGTGALIGKKMDKQKKELEEIREQLGEEKNATIKVSNSVYVGTKLVFGDQCLYIKEKYDYCQFRKEKADIKCSSL